MEYTPIADDDDFDVCAELVAKAAILGVKKDNGPAPPDKDHLKHKKKKAEEKAAKKQRDMELAAKLFGLGKNTHTTSVLSEAPGPSGDQTDNAGKTAVKEEPSCDDDLGQLLGMVSLPMPL